MLNRLFIVLVAITLLQPVNLAALKKAARAPSGAYEGVVDEFLIEHKPRSKTDSDLSQGAKVDVKPRVASMSTAESKLLLSGSNGKESSGSDSDTESVCLSTSSGSVTDAPVSPRHNNVAINTDKLPADKPFEFRFRKRRNSRRHLVADAYDEYGCFGSCLLSGPLNIIAALNGPKYDIHYSDSDE